MDGDHAIIRDVERGLWAEVVSQDREESAGLILLGVSEQRIDKSGEPIVHDQNKSLICYLLSC